MSKLFYLIFVFLIILASYFTGKYSVKPVNTVIKNIVIQKPVYVDRPYIIESTKPPPPPHEIVVYVFRPAPTSSAKPRIVIKVPSVDKPAVAPEIVLEDHNKELVGLSLIGDVDPRDDSADIGARLEIPIQPGVLSFSAETEMDGSEQTIWVTYHLDF